MRRIELLVTLDVEISLYLAERDDVPQLRSKANDTRLETPEQRSRSAVA
jgi:hypothetical protein